MFLIVFYVVYLTVHGGLGTRAATVASSSTPPGCHWSSKHHGGSSCTLPRPADVALQPFCTLPDAVSQEAREVLRTRRVSPQGSLRGKPTAAAWVQKQFDLATAPASQAAKKDHLQSVTNTTIHGIPVYFATPQGLSSKANSSKLLVYLHGGAYIKGSCNNLWQVTALVARKAGLPVLCIEYRLAPQHPFPAGLDDVVRVFKALTTSHGYSASRIGLLGDSAGGGLVLALVQRLQQEQLALPGALGLMAPWLDLRRRGDTLTTLTGVDPVLQYDLNLAESALDYVAGDAARLSDPLVSPLLADYDSQDFPATMIQIGLRDSLLSSSVLLYRKLVAGGVKNVMLSPWEGMWHVFQAALQVPEAQEAAQELASFFTQHLV